MSDGGGFDDGGGGPAGIFGRWSRTCFLKVFGLYYGSFWCCTIFVPILYVGFYARGVLWSANGGQHIIIGPD